MRTPIFIITLLCCSSTARAVTIDFGTGNQSLPYSQNGLTFTQSPGNAAFIRPRSRGDASLVSTSGPAGQIVRAQSASPFNLEMFTIEDLADPWQIVTSAGAVLDITSFGVHDVASVVGFSGITYFDIIYSGPPRNPRFEIDDIQISFVPEPSTLTLLCLISVGLLRRR